MRRILCLLTVFLLVSCWDLVPEPFYDQAEITIDNPTLEPIVVSLDGKEYHIKALTSEQINLKGGKHELVYNGEVAEFLFKPVSDYSVIINPTLSTYILYYNIGIGMFSGDEESVLARAMSNGDVPSFKIDGMDNMALPMELVEGKLFIDRKEYGWRSDLDTELNIENMKIEEGKSYVVAKKLYRIPDYVKSIGIGEYPLDSMQFEKTFESFGELEVIDIFAGITQTNCEKTNKYLTEFKETYAQLLKGDAGEYKKSYERLFDDKLLIYPFEVVKECQVKNKEDIDTDPIAIQQILKTRLQAIKDLNSVLLKVSKKTE